MYHPAVEGRYNNSSFPRIFLVHYSLINYFSRFNRMICVIIYRDGWYKEAVLSAPEPHTQPHIVPRISILVGVSASSVRWGHHGSQDHVRHGSSLCFVLLELHVL